MAGRSKNQILALCEKTIGDIENLKAYRQFKIKLSAFKKIENRISSSRNFGHLSCENAKKRHFSIIFIRYYCFKVCYKQKTCFLKHFFMLNPDMKLIFVKNG